MSNKETPAQEINPGEHFKWNVKLKFLITELIGAGVGAWLAAIYIAFFTGLSREQGMKVITDYAWWVILIPTLCSLPTNEILFAPLNRFLKLYRKQEVDYAALSKAYVRAHNISILHGFFMFTRFLMGAGLMSYVYIALLPPPHTLYQFFNAFLLIAFCGFVSGVLAYLMAERVFVRFIREMNLSVKMIPRKLILDKRVLRITIRQRLLIILVPMILMTILVIGMYSYQEVANSLKSGGTGVPADILTSFLYRLLFVLTTSTALTVAAI